jgi:hypothetical protein
MKNSIKKFFVGAVVLTQSSWAVAAACPQTSPEFVNGAGSVSCANAIRSANAQGSFNASTGTITVDLGLGGTARARGLNSSGFTLVACGAAEDTSPGFGSRSANATITRAACQPMRFIHLTVSG